MHQLKKSCQASSHTRQRGSNPLWTSPNLTWRVIYAPAPLNPLNPLITFALVQVSWSKLATTTTFMVLYPGSRLRIIQQVLDHKANKQRPVSNHQWQTIRLIWLIWHRFCPFDFCLMYISKDPRAAGWLHTGNFALLQGGDRYHCEVAILDDQGWLSQCNTSPFHLAEL